MTSHIPSTQAILCFGHRVVCLVVSKYSLMASYCLFVKAIWFLPLHSCFVRTISVKVRSNDAYSLSYLDNSVVTGDLG